jgi:hypothetical protein
LHLLLDFGSRRPCDGAIAKVEAELPMRLADEVQDRHAIFSLMAPQPAAELLEKHERAFRRPKKEQRIDLREIDPLVEQVYREEYPHPTRAQRGQSGLSRLAVGVR